MELAFKTKPLREICESEEKAKRALGAEMAQVLKSRLADLRAANSIEDLPVAKPRKVSDACVFDLAQGCEFVIVPNHAKTPKRKSGSVDWRKVRRIKIVKIGGNRDR